jgi:hypothetical protein
MSNSKELRSDLTKQQDLTAGALSYTSSIGRRFRLEQVILRFTDGAGTAVAVTETITISLDSKHGEDYDVVLRVKQLSAESNFAFQPEGQINFQSGDEIKVTCTNANLTGVANLIIKTQEVLQ